MTTTSKPDMLLWLSSSRGVYIPRDFAKSFADRAKNVSGVSDEDWAILEAGPETLNDSYWDAWDHVCTNAIVTDEHGVKFFIIMNEDCWLVPVGMKYNEATNMFEWPVETPAAQPSLMSRIHEAFATSDE